MSNRIETNRTNDGFSVKAAGVDIEKTLGTAAYREATTVIAEGKASLPTADAVAQYVVEHGGGTTVVANPTGEATADITKIKINNTIYAISEDSQCEIVPLTENPGILGWVDSAQVVKRDGFAQVMIRCGTKDGGISVEHTKLFSDLPEPDGVSSVSFFGECNGKFYRFYVGKIEGESVFSLICRSKITDAWKEININGIYLCK